MEFRRKSYQLGPTYFKQMAVHFWIKRTVNFFHLRDVNCFTFNFECLTRIYVRRSSFRRRFVECDCVFAWRGYTFLWGKFFVTGLEYLTNLGTGTIYPLGACMFWRRISLAALNHKLYFLEWVLRETLCATFVAAESMCFPESESDSGRNYVHLLIPRLQTTEHMMHCVGIRPIVYQHRSVWPISN